MAFTLFATYFHIFRPFIGPQNSKYKPKWDKGIKIHQQKEVKWYLLTIVHWKKQIKREKLKITVEKKMKWNIHYIVSKDELWASPLLSMWWGLL